MSPGMDLAARGHVRSSPFATQHTFDENVGIGGTLVAEFDVALDVTDRNQLLAGAVPGGDTQPCVGTFLDALVFSAGAGTLAIDYAVDRGCSYHQILLILVPASTATNVARMRITARFVRLTFTNTSGVAQDVEFGSYVRSV